MDHLSLSLFGHFQLSINQQELQGLTSEKGQVLLAYLVLENQQSHSRKKLSTLFWPNGTPTSAQNSLRQTLYRLKTAFAENGKLDQFVTSNRQSVRFDESSSHWTDVNEFQQLITQRKVGNIEFDEKIQLYERLSRLYRGELLAGITVDDSAELDGWLTSRRTWFHNQGLEILHKLIDSYCSLGHLDLAQIYADRLLRLDPLNEKAFEQKVSILLQKGQSAEAQNAFEQFKSLLLHQIGIEPNPAIKILLNSQPSPQRTAQPRPQPQPQTITRSIPPKIQEAPQTFPLPPLPAHHAPFLEDGLSQREPLQALINNPAGKTLLVHGLPGAGKSVLAVEIADKIRGQRPVFYFDLKRLDRDKCQQATSNLNGDPIVVLDHIDRVPQLSSLIGDIFATCERATVIGTSRLMPKLNQSQRVTFECIGLNQAQAIQLILNATSGTLSNNMAEQIAVHLAGHPAAILELFRWNQIFPWEMIAQKIRFGEFLWDETPLADWFDTIWQSLSETELAFMSRLRKHPQPIYPDELAKAPLSFARAAMISVERGLFQKMADGTLTCHPLFNSWIQSKTLLFEPELGPVLHQQTEATNLPNYEIKELKSLDPETGIVRSTSIQ